LLEIPDEELMDRKAVPIAVGAHDVEDGVMNIELLDNSGWAAEVRTASRWEILPQSAAPLCGQDNVESSDFHKAHAIAKEKKVGPTALHY
jgi:hypothetical protein